MAVEVNYGQENLDLREKQNVSQQKLNNYLDEMFEKEEREKLKLQQYLHQKKLESLKYLKLSKLEAQEKKQGRFSTDSGTYKGEDKLKRTDEFFKNLQLKECNYRNLSQTKLHPVKSNGYSKNRVKWQDSELTEGDKNMNLYLHNKLESNSFYKNKYVPDNKHGNMKYDHIDSDYKPKYDQGCYHSKALLLKKHKHSSSRDKIKHQQEYLQRHKVHSQKVTIRKNKLAEKVKSRRNKDIKDKVLKITLKEPNKHKNAEVTKIIIIY